jgi:hypothetical protein
MRSVVDRQVLSAGLVDVCELARAQLVACLGIELSHGSCPHSARHGRADAWLVLSVAGDALHRA